MKIIKYPNSALSTKCEEVTVFDAQLNSELEQMCKLMIENKGIGLAANQVGINKCMFLLMDAETKDIHEFINPKLVGYINEHVLITEGCLSAPGVFIQLPRLKQIEVEAQDKNGESFSCELSGIEAVCFQHELDHLQGIFFLDKAERHQRRKAAKILKLKR